jgi:hypothetical protein
MFISTARVHRGVSVVVAAAIVGVSGLAMERGHGGATPRAAVDFARLQPADVLPAVTELPEVVVTASRLTADGHVADGA